MVSSSSPTPSESIDQLFKWIERAPNAHIGNISIQTDTKTNERSLQNTKPIKSGETIIRIPHSHLITTTLAKNDDLVKQIIKQTKEDEISSFLPDTVSESAAMLLYLLKERCKQEEGFWYPWFQSLPKKFITPLTISNELPIADHLGSTPSYPFVIQLREELKEMYFKWFVPFVLNKYPNDFNKELCEFNDTGFLYVHAIIESRTFKLNDHSDVIIAPIIDMANHKFSYSNECNSKTQGWVIEGSASNDIGLELICKHDILNVNDEICISYGNLANWELLVHFGFTLLKNKFDGIMVQVDAEEINKNDDYETNMRKLIILNVQVPEFESGFNLSLSNPLPHGLIRGARILMSTEKEMEGGARKDFGTIISIENERIVIKWLRSIVDTLQPETMDDGDDDDDDDDGDDGSEPKTNKEDEKKLWNYCNIYVDSLKEVINLTQNQIMKLEDNLKVYSSK